MLAEHDAGQPQRLAATATAAAGSVVAAAKSPSGLRRALRLFALVYTGKPGHPAALRAGQGALASLLTLGLVAGLSGSPDDTSTQSTRDRLAATATVSPSPETAPSDAVELASPLPLIVTSPFVPPASSAKPPRPSRRPSSRPRLSPPAPPPPPPADPRLGGPWVAGCESAYPDFCIPGGRDYNCPEIPAKNFTALWPDPYRLDGNDHDGIACES